MTKLGGSLIALCAGVLLTSAPVLAVTTWEAGSCGSGSPRPGQAMDVAGIADSVAACDGAQVETGNFFRSYPSLVNPAMDPSAAMVPPALVLGCSRGVSCSTQLLQWSPEAVSPSLYWNGATTDSIEVPSQAGVANPIPTPVLLLAAGVFFMIGLKRKKL